MTTSTRGRGHLAPAVPARLAGQIAIGARMLSLDGHDDFNQGQISARMPGSSTFFIKNALCGFDEASPDQVVAASVDPAAATHPLAPPELPLHQAIYRARPDVNGIVHSHAPHTLVFGAADLELRPVSHDGAHFAGRLGLFTRTSNTVLDQETGEAIAETLGDGEGVLLRNHGGVVVGKSVRHAAVFAQVLERACRLQLLAEQSGVPYTWATDDDIRLKRDFIYADLSVRSYWDYAVRRVGRVWPEAVPW
ncbi:class II aldolase/adducin family protein [Streptomyces albidoflavus]|uniref:class II aldolase/adducin family protein n=1 Tax=Streptomyces albidoflavus TaxID=1886 RepID=UPI00101E6597|nr:class II aldolase/adducin family protein [Streptomyces albidoflavus]RZD87861.1 class II aldolase family protein [Streptomyces albidoflavus]RZE03336.1 class II aldolase family protein [Streptomyces albidoflavus]